MKNILFILFLFLSAYSIAQKNEWAPVGAKWYYTLQRQVSPPFNIGFVQIISTKDTVVSGKFCSVLQKTVFLPDKNGIDTINDGIEIMYSDSSKIYRFIDGKFYVLYDFSVQSGDTLEVYVGKNSYVKLAIDSVSSEIINNDTLRVLYLTPITLGWVGWGGNTGKVIEKIGSIKYMFLQSELDCDGWGNCFGPLRCYEDSNITYTTISDQSCDTIIVLSQNDNKYHNNITLFPTFFNDIVRVKIDSDKNITYSLFIYDVLGQLIYEEKNIFNTDIAINLSDFKNGVYLLKLNSNEACFVQKIVKY